jgi:hypothetical protein
MELVMAGKSHPASVRDNHVFPGCRAALALTAAAAACLAAVGCGGGGGGADPLAGTPAKQVVAKAVADLRAAKSFTMQGDVNQSGETIGVDLGYLAGKGCAGTVSEAGKGSFALVVIGSTAWIKPSDKFLESTAGSQASAAIALLKGRYLKGSTSDSAVASLTAVCDVNHMTSSFTQTGTLIKGKVSTLGGQQVLPVTDKTKGGTMDVTDSATPQIVQITNTTGQGGSTGQIKFDVGKQVTLTAPPASQTISGAPFGL